MTASRVVFYVNFFTDTITSSNVICSHHTFRCWFVGFSLDVKIIIYHSQASTHVFLLLCKDLMRI